MSANKAANAVCGGIGGAAGVGAQVQNEGAVQIVVLGQRLGDGFCGGVTEADALDHGHPVHQRVGDDGHLYLPAGEGQLPGGTRFAGEDGQRDPGALLTGQGRGLLRGGDGHSVNGLDAVALLQSGLLRRGVGENGQDQKSVFRDFLLNGHADPHQSFPVDRVQEGTVLLLGHVDGVGVTQSFQHGVQILLGQNGVGNLVHIELFQKSTGLLDGKGGDGSQAQGTRQGHRQAGRKDTFHR